MHLPGYTAESALSRPIRPVAHRSFAPWRGDPPGADVVEPARSASTGLSAGRARGLGFSCGGSACICSGDADCNDMFSTNVCGPDAVCLIIGTQVLCMCGR